MKPMEDVHPDAEVVDHYPIPLDLEGRGPCHEDDAVVIVCACGRQECDQQ